jgi:hypothetical protein
VSVLQRSLHVGPRTSITTPLRSKGLGLGLSCFCTLKYASSQGRGNVVIPKGFPRSVGRVESRLLGFPCFPYSVISMACFGGSGLSDTGLGSVRISSRAVNAASVDVHVCLVCRLFPLMRLNCLDPGAPIDSVLVHCSKPVFSKFGASAAVSHRPFYSRGCDSPRTASGPLRGIFEV